MSKNILFRLKQMLVFIIPTIFGAILGYSQRVIWYTLVFTILGIFTYLVLLIFHPWYKEIKKKMKRDEVTKEFYNILKLASIQIDRLPIHLLLEEYISDKDFWQEKLAIGEFIMTMNENVGSIILDTGTTSSAVAIMLMSDKAWPDKIMTNSVTIANFISANKAIKPSSSPTIERIKSVCASGKYSAFILLFANPKPVHDPEPIANIDNHNWYPVDC